MESVKEEPQALLHLLVRVQDGLVRWAIEEADRQRRLQLAAPGFVQNATLQAGFEDMQLGLAHGPFEPQQEAVVELGRIIEAVLIENKRVRQGAELQQTVPIGGVACQPRDFQALDDARLPKLTSATSR